MSSIELSIHRESSDLQALEGFPATERWRLFTDLDRQHREEDVFELEEPGYFDGMWNTFIVYMKTVGTRVSEEIFCRMHDCCVQSVRRRLEGDAFLLGYATGYTYGLHPSKITDNAKLEWDVNNLIWTSESTKDHRLHLAI